MNTQKTTHKMKRAVNSGSLGLTLASIVAAAMFAFPTVIWSQTTEWTVYNTSNSGLPFNTIAYPLAIDAQGNVWTGSGEHVPASVGGLAKFDRVNWTVYNKENSGMPFNLVYTLAIDAQGNLWIGSVNFDEPGGLVVYSGAHTRLKVVSATTTFGATVVGQPTPLEVTVALAPPLESIELYRRMVLDLSLLGIPSDLPLEHMGDGDTRPAPP